MKGGEAWTVDGLRAFAAGQSGPGTLAAALAQVFAQLDAAHERIALLEREHGSQFTDAAATVRGNQYVRKTWTATGVREYYVRLGTGRYRRLVDWKTIALRAEIDAALAAPNSRGIGS